MRQLLREVVSTGHEPRELFTQGFGPNVRPYNACVGSQAMQKAYVASLFAEDIASLGWVDVRDARKHVSKEDVFMSLLSLPGVGCLTGENIFQTLRRVPAMRGFKAAGGNSRADSSSPFALNVPG